MCRLCCCLSFTSRVKQMENEVFCFPKINDDVLFALALCSQSLPTLLCRCSMVKHRVGYCPASPPPTHPAHPAHHSSSLVLLPLLLMIISANAFDFRFPVELANCYFNFLFTLQFFNTHPRANSVTYKLQLIRAN